jgi:excisionase family DNA binding protein
MLTSEATTRSSRGKKGSYMIREVANKNIHPALRVPGYLSVKAAAEWLGIRERSVLYLIERRRLASSRLGRMHFIPTRDVSAYGTERKLRQRRAKQRGHKAA